MASYQIDAKFEAELHRLKGHETIVFLNASSAPVSELWFHLYLNAFKNDKTLFLRSPFGAGRSGGQGARVRLRRRQKAERGGRSGDDLWATRDRHSPGDPDDETDLRVPLPSPIEPGATLSLELEFEAQMPEIVERTGYAGSFHFFGQWFPKLARLEPDGRFTHFAFHAQSEFYADFGDYTVHLDVPAAYRVGATGVLVRESERQGRRQLEYRAQNVHDFAWTAWTLRIAQRAHRRHAGHRALPATPSPKRRGRAFQRAFRAAPLQSTLRRVPLPTLTVVHPPDTASNAGGMEYPTLITSGGPWFGAIGGARELDVVTTHELGHQWFYGLLASNEHASPFLDEGFNSYAEAESLEAQYGAGSVFDGFGLRASSTALNRLFSAARGGDEKVGQGAADFASFRSMGALVYSRTAIALATIERVYGRARFQRAFGLYTRSQRFKHPTWQDFVSSTLGELDAPAVGALTTAFFERGTVDYLVRDISNAPVTPAAGVFDGPSGARKQEAGGGQRRQPVCQSRGRIPAWHAAISVDIALSFEDGTRQCAIGTARAAGSTSTTSGRRAWRPCTSIPMNASCSTTTAATLVQHPGRFGSALFGSAAVRGAGRLRSARAMSASVSTSSTSMSRWTASATASVLLWISRTVLGLLVVFPILQAIKVSNMVSGPEGDAVLFRPGSLLLLELFRVGLPALSASLRSALLLAVIAAVVQLVPLALALDVLWFEGASLAARFRRAFQLFPGFLGLGAIASLTQAALLLLASLLSAALKSPLQGSDERLATLLPLGLLALTLIGCGFVGCVLDIARAALVRDEQGFRDALIVALNRLREQPLVVLAGGYPVAAAGAFAGLCCVWLTPHLDLSRGLASSLALSFVAHQSAILFAIAWRVRWLRHALELGESSDR